MKRLLAISLSTVMAMIAVGSMIGAQAGSLTCFDEEVTIARGGGDNVVHGTSGPDVISTGGGDDVVYGRGGADRICLGSGSDDAFGNGGGDLIDGGGGADAATKGEPLGEGLQGMGGNDWIYGRNGTDRVEGGDGEDRLFGGGDDDLLNGYDGEGGNDILDGGPEDKEDACDGTRDRHEGCTNPGNDDRTRSRTLDRPAGDPTSQA
ncbi:MAG TPA: hypothetical protein VEV82_07025 [Actinomycetota bacterium]|nr:hypothetical protein [Actinomycetota bacterium]